MRARAFDALRHKPGITERSRPSPLRQGTRVAGIDAAGASGATRDADVLITAEEVALAAAIQSGVDAVLAKLTPFPVGDFGGIAGIDGARARVTPRDADVLITGEEIALAAAIQSGVDAVLAKLTPCPVGDFCWIAGIDAAGTGVAARDPNVCAISKEVALGLAIEAAFLARVE